MGAGCSAVQKSNAVVTPLRAEKKATGTSVAIIYYSMYGHITQMVKSVKRGLEKGGVSVDVFQVPETLPVEVLKKMGAPAKPTDVMTLDYTMTSKLDQYDGFMLGIPTRFGSMCAQMKSWIDSTGSLWQAGKLAGKPVATFVSTGTANGGQETTHMTSLTNFVHHGMVYVPLGYQAGPRQFNMEEQHGGSPWGASCFAGADGSRQPSDLELAIAEVQGERFAAAVTRTVSKPVSRKVKICIVYYSMYGHLKKMVDVIAGAVEYEGVQVDLYQVKELMDEATLKKMGAPPKAADPIIEHSNIEKLTEYDGIMFGLPTRFGQEAEQVKAFWGATGKLWQQGALTGKLGASFVSTGTQQGGQETTHLTHVTHLVHHGMIFVPLGYQAGADQFTMGQVMGSSPWGASTLAGADGSRQPSELELRIAAKQGQVFASKVMQMAL